ncbi:hypothetical protein ACSBR2_011617 [Camellia fascicularis]
MTCSCIEWEISGIPCTHAMAAISHSRINVENFVYPYYSKQKYLIANDGIIHPISYHTLWDEELLQPPPLKNWHKSGQKDLGTIRGHVREVQSGVAEETAFHLAEAWVLHLTEEADLLVEEALHLVEKADLLAYEALHLGEVEANEALHL